MSDGGKGSAPRPFSVSQEEYDSRWDVIFGRDKLSKEQEDDLKKYINDLKDFNEEIQKQAKEYNESSGSNTNDRK